MLSHPKWPYFFKVDYTSLNLIKVLIFLDGSQNYDATHIYAQRAVGTRYLHLYFLNGWLSLSLQVTTSLPA